MCVLAHRRVDCDHGIPCAIGMLVRVCRRRGRGSECEVSDRVYCSSVQQTRYSNTAAAAAAGKH
jgi:hypothetical protein